LKNKAFAISCRKNGEHIIVVSKYSTALCKCKCKCKFNVKHRECLRDRPSQRLMTKVPDVQIELEFRNVGFEERGKPEYQEKNLSEQSREPTTNSTHI